jgi:uncharacterized membrane protein YjgN (DUF898 family)
MSDIRAQTFGRRDGGGSEGEAGEQGGFGGGGTTDTAQFRGAAGELWGIILVNAVLSLFTVGIYRFWGRTRIRRYLWGRTEYLGDAVEYTGTGGELFVGFLIIFFLVLLPISIVFAVLAGFLEALDPGLSTTIQFALQVFLVYLIGIALYRARRYRLSRSTWRGIRFAQSGSSLRYGLLFFGYLVSGVLTLGLVLPFWHVKRWSFHWNNSWFGDRPFSFDGAVGPLYPPFLIAWLLFLPTMGLSYAWYKARLFGHLAQNTRYEGQEFAFTVTPGRLIGYAALNILLVWVTLGLAYPIAQMRAVRLMTEHLQLPQEVDFEAIAQSAAERPEIGEGLADAFDVGAV